MRKAKIPDNKILMHEDMFMLDYGKFVRGLASKKSMHMPAQDGVMNGEVVAYINHGRWIAECPDCNGAQVASEELRFWCVSCGNASVLFAWKEVVMPKSKKSIEGVLLDRPTARPDKAVTRNWKPGESVKDLKKENAAHGVVTNS
jgi:hypothetical protein